MVRVLHYQGTVCEGHLYPIRAGGLQLSLLDEGASYLSFQVARAPDKSPII